jgi:hypothetical protein
VGEWQYNSTILDFGTKWRKMASFTTRPLYPRGKRRLGGPQSRSGRYGEESCWMIAVTDSTAKWYDTLHKHLYDLPCRKYGIYKIKDWYGLKPVSTCEQNIIIIIPLDSGKELHIILHITRKKTLSRCLLSSRTRRVKSGRSFPTFGERCCPRLQGSRLRYKIK